MLDFEEEFRLWMESMEWSSPPGTKYTQEEVKELVEGNLRGFCIMLEIKQKRLQNPTN
jgi:hypothetical protein